MTRKVPGAVSKPNPDVLAEILAGVRVDLAGRARHRPLAAVRRAAEQAPPPRDAVAALRGRGVALIAEVKRASPSAGPLAAVPDPAGLARRYQAGGAQAISVLTERRRFRGSLADLAAVRRAVDLPVLQKDFLLSRYQVWEARAHGADLVLLIVAALSQPLLEQLIGTVRGAGMTPLVEVHDPVEVDRALAAGADVVGVNARDLHTLRVDGGLFAALRPLLPDPVVKVAESGVHRAEQMRDYAATGADAVLVGEALVTHPDPQRAVAELVAAGTRAGQPAR